MWDIIKYLCFYIQNDNKNSDIWITYIYKNMRMNLVLAFLVHIFFKNVE